MKILIMRRMSDMYIPDSHDPYPRHWKERARKEARELAAELNREERARKEARELAAELNREERARKEAREREKAKKDECICFIASVVYGDSNIREINTLREYRDNVLMQDELGKKFVEWYYGGGGERMAEFIEKKARFLIPVIRKGLDFIVEDYKQRRT